MNAFRVCVKVEQDGPAEQDLEVVKIVQASNDSEAAEKAALSVSRENPGINAAKIWASSREEIRNRLVAKALFEATHSVME